MAEIYAATAFRRINYVKEVTPGTAIAATVVAQGSRITTFPLADHVYHTFEDETTGLLAPHVTPPLKIKTEANFVWEGALNNVDGKIPLNMALTQEAAGVWQPDWNTPGNAPRSANGSYTGIYTYTFEYGDVVHFYETEYCFARRLQIVGRGNELITFTCDITGRQCTETTETGALSRGTVYYFPFELCKFYDATTFANLAIAPSQLSGVLKGFTWTLDTAFAPMYAADGAAYFSKVIEAKKRVVLELTIARDNTISEAMFDAYQAQTIEYLRIKPYDTHADYFDLDGAYRYVDWALGDEDGLAVCIVTAESVWDPTASNSFKVTYTAA